MSDDPPNIQEFNVIAGLIFAQLYKTFPEFVNINRGGIAKQMGIEGNDWGAHKLPSGRTFSQALELTSYWLKAEDYTRAVVGSTAPWERITLTTKGLAAMNAVPSGLNQKVGVELMKAVDQAPASGVNQSTIGDLIGSIFGSTLPMT
jgi:hypothetical protein